MTHEDSTQAEVVEFLSRPSAYPHGPGEVERIETHGAIVFMAGAFAYKVKRAVRYPYMDFSTLERRRSCCEAEVALNRRTAPSLYVGVKPVVRRPDGSLSLDGEGDAVEWAVVMRRFDQKDLWDALAQRDALTSGLVEDLARHVASFHLAAAPADEGSRWGGAAAFRASVEGNLAELDGGCAWFAAERVDRLRDSFASGIDALVPLLDARKAAGLVRRCHGDLHLRNICLVDGRPTLFDAIEFNDALGWIDVLYDVAFLLMDLEHRGLRGCANLFLNRYLILTGDFAGLGALPVFFADRALVRAKVVAATARLAGDEERLNQLRREAEAYFASAEAYLQPSAPCMVAVGGISGTGKTSLAARLAPTVGPAPGAIHLRTDVLRKRLFDVADTDRLPELAYAPEQHDRVFSLMFDRARSVLATGHGVVLDGVFGKPAERQAAADVAAQAGVPFTGFWLEAPADVLADRVAAREGDASDATPDVVRRQVASDMGEIDWLRIRADRLLSEIVDDARRILDADRVSVGKPEPDRR